MQSTSPGESGPVEHVASYFANLRIGVIGCGNMGRAIVSGLLDKRLVDTKALMVLDRKRSGPKDLSGSFAVQQAESVTDLLTSSDIVLICVKPGDVFPLIERIKLECPEEVGRIIWISIAAGVRLETLQLALGEGAQVARVMPNLPVVVGAGMSVVYADSDREADLALKLFSSVGRSLRVRTEAELDVATALSAGGPAFLAIAFEGLVEGAVKMGISREHAILLTAQTALGTASLVLDDGLGPEQIGGRVASPGGTTIQGLHELEKAAVRAAFMSALEASTTRARQLAQKV